MTKPHLDLLHRQLPPPGDERVPVERARERDGPHRLPPGQQASRLPPIGAVGERRESVHVAGVRGDVHPHPARVHRANVRVDDAHGRLGGYRAGGEALGEVGGVRHRPLESGILGEPRGEVQAAVVTFAITT